jgi:hypothetical protein
MSKSSRSSTCPIRQPALETGASDTGFFFSVPDGIDDGRLCFYVSIFIRPSGTGHKQPPVRWVSKYSKFPHGKGWHIETGQSSPHAATRHFRIDQCPARSHQSTRPSGPYFRSSQSFAALKCPLPIKPLFALNGDGCCDHEATKKSAEASRNIPHSFYRSIDKTVTHGAL